MANMHRPTPLAVAKPTLHAGLVKQPLSPTIKKRAFESKVSMNSEGSLGSMSLEVLDVLQKQHVQLMQGINSCLVAQEETMTQILDLSTRLDGTIIGATQVAGSKAAKAPRPPPSHWDATLSVEVAEVPPVEETEEPRAVEGTGTFSPCTNSLKSELSDVSCGSRERRKNHEEEQDERQKDLFRRSMTHSVNADSVVEKKISTKRVSRSSLTGELMSWQERVVRMVEGARFEGFFALVIVANSFMIGVEIEVSTGSPDATVQRLIQVGQYVFTFTFFIEICVRIFAYRGSFFCTNVLWHNFDFLLVLASVLEIALEVFFSSGIVDAGTNSLANVRLFRILRITRLVKLLRIARIVRLVRALRILVHSIMTTVKSLVWSLMLLGMIIYLFGILFAQAVLEHLDLTECGDDVSCSDNQSTLKGDWAGVPIAMLTLYESISGGKDWDLVIRPLAEVSWFWACLFIAYVSFCMLAVLNVMTGVFCQAAIESAHHDRDLMIQQLLHDKALYTSKIKTQFQAMFDAMDRAGHGEITLTQFQHHIMDDTVQAYFALLELDSSDAYTLFKLLEEDTPNQIDADHFVDGCMRLRGQARSIDLAKHRHESRSMMKAIASRMDHIEQRVVMMQNQARSIPAALEAFQSGATITLQATAVADADQQCRQSLRSTWRGDCPPEVPCPKPSQMTGSALNAMEPTSSLKRPFAEAEMLTEQSPCKSSQFGKCAMSG